jgi:hypothetical protein
MIYLFCGDDIKKKNSACEQFIGSLKEGAEIFPISRNNFDSIQIESLYSGSSLFSPAPIAVFSDVLGYEETREFILDKLESIGASRNTFIFKEGKLSKLILDAFKKARAKTNVFELPKEKLEKFDNFLVANAFAGKDKLNTWIYFRQAMDLGVGMEEIIGVLFWKVKDLILKKNFSKFKEEQLKNFAARLSCLLPEARKNGRDAESAFERFLLEAF